MATDLKRVYSAATVEEAELMLTQYETKWDKNYLSIGLSWRRNWARITPFFNYPPEIRKVIYKTNAIESIHMSLRKIIKTRSSFPTDDVCCSANRITHAARIVIPSRSCSTVLIQ